MFPFVVYLTRSFPGENVANYSRFDRWRGPWPSDYAAASFPGTLEEVGASGARDGAGDERGS